MASGGASITISRDVRTATTQTYDAYFSMTRLRRLSVATSSTIFLARLIRNSGIGRGEVEDDVEAHPGLVVAFPREVVLTVLAALLEGLRGVPDHPVVTPVVLEHLLVGDAHDLQRRLHVARPAVGVPVDHLGAFVQRRPRRHLIDVGERVQNRFGRGLEDDFPRCSDSHDGRV